MTTFSQYHQPGRGLAWSRRHIGQVSKVTVIIIVSVLVSFALVQRGSSRSSGTHHLGI